MGWERVRKTIWMAIFMSIMAVAGVHADDYEFKSDGALPGHAHGTGVAFGDLNGDTIPDIFVSNGSGNADTVWLNDGDGNFEIIDQLGASNSTDVALKDLDDDGFLDAFVTIAGEPNIVWFNKDDGSGTFGDVIFLGGNSDSTGVALGDLDNDGDVDAFVTNKGGQPNEVWLNDGSGNFTKDQEFGDDSNSMGVALEDLNGDGYLDAFVVNAFSMGATSANEVWLNDVSGNFVKGQELGDSSSMGVALGDLDNDGDVDAFVVNEDGDTQYDTIWLKNDSNGLFEPKQYLDNRNGTAVALADFDGDGYLDAFVTNQIIDNNKENTVWRNNGDGTGTFSDSYQTLGSSDSQDVALADINDDGYIDAVVANMQDPNTLWRIDGPPSSGGGGGGGGGCFIKSLVP